MTAPCWFYGQRDVFDATAAYTFCSVPSQAFLDGNKRTGMSTALVLLEGNGVPVPEAADELYGAMLAMAERRMDKTGLAALLRKLHGVS